MTVVLVFIGISAIAGGSYVAYYPDPSAKNAAYDQKVAALQGVAAKACQCERRAESKDTKTSCWAELNRLLPLGSETATMCAPVSAVGRCGGTGEMAENPDGSFHFDSGPCVTEHYEYFSSKGETILLCSKGEAQMVERAWYKEVDPDAQGHFSTTRTDQLARDLVAGKSPRAIDGPEGCTG